MCSEKAHQSIGLGAHVLQIQGQDEDTHQRHIDLTGVAGEDVSLKGHRFNVYPSRGQDCRPQLLQQARLL